MALMPHQFKAMLMKSALARQCFDSVRAALDNLATVATFDRA
jgi:hypothetical protein